MLHRLELLEKIDNDDRETILKVVDNYLTTAQLQTTTKKLKQKRECVNVKIRQYQAYLFYAFLFFHSLGY